METLEAIDGAGKLRRSIISTYIGRFCFEKLMGMAIWS